MKLLLIRHAKAEEHDPARWPEDSLRPLTDKGIERFNESAKGLAKLFTPGILLTSPFVRAVQTSEILHEAAGWPEPHQLDAIPQGTIAPLLINHCIESETSLAIVGHEPTLSMLVSTIVSDTDSAAIRMKPGAAALIEIYRDALPDLSGELTWLIQPKISGRIS